MPVLDAAIDWQGECGDAAALHAEVRARGAELREPNGDHGGLTLSVSVRREPPQGLVAEILLRTSDAQEQRRVDAQDCVALRRAVAWVLGVLAEERAQAALAEAKGASAAEFPPVPATPAPATSEPPAAPPQPVPAPAQEPRQERSPCAHVAPRFHLATELVVGAFWVDTVALGPALSARYRPCAKWWPGFSFGASHLVSLGYSLDARSIALQRTSAHVGVWLPLPLPSLRGGLAVEVGRLRASSVGSADGPGGDATAPWAALVSSWRWSAPLIPRRLSAELGVDLLYTPLGYRLRYRSGAGALAEPSHFELRTALGVAGHF